MIFIKKKKKKKKTDFKKLNATNKIIRTQK